MPRPQFTLRALLVAVLVVAVFFAGELTGRKREHVLLDAEHGKLAAERSKIEKQWRYHEFWAAEYKKAVKGFTPEFLKKVERYRDHKKWALDLDESMPTASRAESPAR